MPEVKQVNVEEEQRKEDTEATEQNQAAQEPKEEGTPEGPEVVKASEGEDKANNAITTNASTTQGDNHPGRPREPGQGKDGPTRVIEDVLPVSFIDCLSTWAADKIDGYSAGDQPITFRFTNKLRCDDTFSIDLLIQHQVGNCSTGISGCSCHRNGL